MGLKRIQTSTNNSLYFQLQEVSQMASYSYLYIARNQRYIRNEIHPDDKKLSDDDLTARITIIKPQKPPTPPVIEEATP